MAVNSNYSSALTVTQSITPGGLASNTATQYSTTADVDGRNETGNQVWGPVYTIDNVDLTLSALPTDTGTVVFPDGDVIANIKLVNPEGNGPVTVGPGVNAYALFGTGNSVEVPGGCSLWMTFQGNLPLIDTGVADQISITGTLTETVEVILVSRTP
jgi:hypothetical protein